MPEKEIEKVVFNIQQKEITQHSIYRRLERIAKKERNRRILRKIAQCENDQYEFWKKITGREANPKKVKVFIYVLMARILGPSFTLKLMEKEKSLTQETYSKLKAFNGEADKVIKRGEAEELDIFPPEDLVE